MSAGRAECGRVLGVEGTRFANADHAHPEPRALLATSRGAPRATAAAAVTARLRRPLCGALPAFGFLSPGHATGSLGEAAIFGATHWALEQFRPQRNRTLNNRTNLASRNIDDGLDPKLLPLAKGRYD